VQAGFGTTSSLCHNRLGGCYNSVNIEEQIDKLQSEIDRYRKQIRSDSYSMSIGEWISLYEQHDIEIIAEFPKTFRWTDSQKTKLIESILLGIPIPSI
jgi:hypothetical protein